MLKWLKKLLVAEESSDSAEEDEPSFTDTLQLVTVWGVVEHFLESNPTPTPYSVHALVDAGASDLLDPDELLEACDKIKEHGYQYPINGVLMAEMEPAELLSYLRWHQKTGVAKGCYDNEPKIRELIARFRSGV
jgi:hypothetical protein